MNATKMDRRLDPATSANARSIAYRNSRNRSIAENAHIIPLLSKLRSEGVSLNRIAAMLNEEGFRTRQGCLFLSSTLTRLCARIDKITSSVKED